MTAIREVREDQHGTVTGYAYGCRCHECRVAKSERPVDHEVGEEVRERVYAALEHEADLDGISTASGDRLGELAGVSGVSARAAIKVLAGMGRIRVVGRAGVGGALEVHLGEAS